MKAALFGAALAAIAGSVAADPAQAAFDFRLERLSDTEVRLTGAGSADTTDSDVYGVLELEGVAPDTAQTTSGPMIGDFKLGTLNDAQYFVVLGVMSFVSFAGDSPYRFTGTDTASGTSTLTKTGGTGFRFADIGTTGKIFINFPDGTVADRFEAGTWTMVAPVPIPAALPLFGAALAGLGLVARRKRNPEPA
jgi:hypothetical protein